MLKKTKNDKIVVFVMFVSSLEVILYISSSSPSSRDAERTHGNRSVGRGDHLPLFYILKSDEIRVTFRVGCVTTHQKEESFNYGFSAEILKSVNILSSHKTFGSAKPTAIYSQGGLFHSGTSKQMLRI